MNNLFYHISTHCLSSDRIQHKEWTHFKVWRFVEAKLFFGDVHSIWIKRDQVLHKFQLELVGSRLEFWQIHSVGASPSILLQLSACRPFNIFFKHFFGFARRRQLWAPAVLFWLVGNDTLALLGILSRGGTKSLFSGFCKEGKLVTSRSPVVLDLGG